MIEINTLKSEFTKHGGIMKTLELKTIGVNSRQILKLVNNSIISKIKRGFYELNDIVIPEEVIIAKIFPTSIIYLESALLYYNYTDRIPSTWQIAVDKNISKPQFNISYPPITPFYLEKSYINIGVSTFDVNGVSIRIYDKERTICDVLRYVNKLDREVFNNAIQRYIKDNDKNISQLIKYAKKLRVNQKVKTFIGMWI